MTVDYNYIDNMPVDSLEHKLWEWFRQTKEYKDILECKYCELNGRKNAFHEEDNVGLHTWMVYREVIAAYRNKVDDDYYFTLLMTALCHDLGYPLSKTRNKKNKGLNFYNHESVSFFLTLNIFHKYIQDGCVNSIYKINEKIMSDILYIVTNHNIYVYQEKDLYRIYKDKLKITYDFALCNARGRKCKNKHRHDLTYVNDFIHTNIPKVKEKETDKELFFIVDLINSESSNYVNNIVGDNKLIDLDNCGINNNFMTVNDILHKAESDNDINTLYFYITAFLKNERDRIIKGIALDQPARQFIKKIKKTAVIICTPFNIFEECKDLNKLDDNYKYIAAMMKCASIPTYKDFDEVKYVFTDSLQIK